MDKEKVLQLAKLARIEISDAEAETLTKEFEGILNYVADVKSVKGQDTRNKTQAIRNVMRDDGEGHESGVHTEEILAGAPARQGNFIKVKKIIG